MEEEKKITSSTDSINEETSKIKVEKEPEVVTTTKEKKKGSGCLKGCLIALIILFVILLLLAGAGFFAYRRAMKSIETAGGGIAAILDFIDLEQEDLGVTYTMSDYDALMDSFSFESDPSILCLDCPPVTFSNPQEASLTVTNSQASAGFDQANSDMGFSNTQIKFNDGNAEFSTLFVFEGRTIPVYMKGTLSKTSEQSISGNISDLKIGILGLPANIKDTVQNELNSRANSRLAEAGDTVRIDTLEITENGLIFEGMLPTQAR